MNNNNIFDNQNSISSTNNLADIIYCDRCGSEMKKSARYCMKCGNLNYMHPENESMKQYAFQNVNQGQFISNINSDFSVSDNINRKSFKTCFIVNLIFHVLILIGCILLNNTDEFILVGIISFITCGLLFLFNYSFQCIYIKSGKPWWSYYVPIYSNYVFFEITMGSGWLFLITCIPVVGTIINLIAYYRLGQKFYKSGILTLLFPFIMVPVIGLSKSAQISMFAQKNCLIDSSVDTNGKTKSEREYGRNKTIITIILLIIVFILLYFGWGYIKSFIIKFYQFFMEQLEFFK